MKMYECVDRCMNTPRGRVSVVTRHHFKPWKQALLGIKGGFCCKEKKKQRISIISLHDERFLTCSKVPKKGKWSLKCADGLRLSVGSGRA
jgi:hypothetical protein